MRFHAIGEPVATHRVRYESEDGRDGTWLVHAENADGTQTSAVAIPVEDSSAGSSTMIYGAAHGLRLTPEDGGDPIAEPYLLLSNDAVLE